MPQEVLAARRTAATRPPPPREASLPSPAPSTEAVQPDTVPPGATPARAGEAAAGPDPLVGQKVGSFMVQHLLGKGGMGTVYLAEHPVIGSKVAIKFLHESLGSEPQTVARFYDEAKAVNLIGHENIVGIYDLNLLPPNRYYYVMEYLEGSTLAALEKQGRLPVKVQLDVLNQLCDALQRAHERGVVHRDLKPENVFLVQRRGKAHFVKLVDFGIAKLRGAAGANRVTGRTEAGVIIGTPEYMAPEQCEDGTIDARTDVYALGVMAFEMATGRLPFGGRSVTQLLLAHLQKAPPRPSELAPVEASLERAILRALEKDPADRFQDMASFAEALRDVPREPRRAAPAPVVAPVAAPAVAPATSGKPPAAAPALTPAPGQAPAITPLPTPPIVTAEVRSGDAAPVSLPITEITRAGLFLGAEKGLPPLMSRVLLSLSHPSLRGRVELAGQVVRHVTPAEAHAWKMLPGYAVQFMDPAPEARAVITLLADEQRRDVGREAAPVRPARSPEERLRVLEARAGQTPYELLGLKPDAEFSEVRRALKALRDDLEDVRTRPGAPEHPSRAAALLARVDAAQAALGAPPARLAHDAQRGNFRGVARCVSAGVPAALIEARRRSLLAEKPERAAEAQRQLARAQVARRLGNPGAALAAYEAALAADPLDLATLEAWQAYRREHRADE
ncbi:MAG: serine/threonine-protein kinase [Anaeromyxobacteraceae bacterium]